MSRSRPQADSSQNPAKRWFEWGGARGVVHYYDKAAKETREVPLPFTFLLLDQLATIGGYQKSSNSGIYANEVRDTRTDVLVVKSYKGGAELANGLYAQIKGHITSKSVGGHFVANCYIAFRGETGALQIGAIKMKGAALGAWMEFSKAHRHEMYEKAIAITGSVEGRNGSNVFRVPTFALKDVTSQQTSADATALDETLQAYLDSYLQRNTRDEDASRAHDEPPSDDEEYIGAVTADDPSDVPL